MERSTSAKSGGVGDNPRRFRGRWWKATCIVAVILVCSALGLWFVPQWCHKRHVRRLIVACKRRPSGPARDMLVDMLSRGQLSDSHVKHALQVLGQPEIVTRDTYRAGEPAWVKVERPLGTIERPRPGAARLSLVGSATGKGVRALKVIPEELDVLRLIPGTEYWAITPSDSFPHTLNTRIEIQYEYEAWSYSWTWRWRRPLWRSLVPVQIPLEDSLRRIEGRIQVPVTLNFVPQQEAEEVKLVTDSSVAEDILQVTSSPPIQLLGADPPSRRTFRLTPSVIKLPRLRAPLVSRLWFQGKGWRRRLSAPPRGDPARGNPPAEGDEWLSIVIVKKGPAEITIEDFSAGNITDFPIGHHEGFIVFEPDPDLAQKDPTIKSIIGLPIRIPALLEVEPAHSADPPSHEASEDR